MAQIALSADELMADALPDFVQVRTDQIDIGERLRQVDMIWAEALGQVMLREGQRTPIEICRLPGSSRWTLVAGGHRFAGAQKAGIEYLRAEIVYADRDMRRSREISENLWRNDLAPLDRAAFIAEAVAIQKRRAGIDPNKDGRAVSAAIRWQKQVQDEAEDATATIAVAYNLSAELVEAIGLSARTIRDDLMLYRRLPASVVEHLRRYDHPILYHFGQLKALAKLDQATQERVVTRLTDEREDRAARDVGEALAQLGLGTKAATDPETKRLSTFIGAFSRMGLAEKKGALAQLAGMLPAGFSLVEGEQKPARPAYSVDHERYRDEALEQIDTVRELIAGLEEDEAIPGDRGADLYSMGARLALTRMSIAGSGFELSAPDEGQPA